MSTYIPNVFTINGVIDTSKDVMSNINTMASACSSWVTFDVHTGKWSVVFNSPAISSTQSTRTAKSITTYNQASLSTVQKKFGAGSIRFDGNGDYMRVAGGTTSDFQFGYESFTIEFWVYRLPGGTNEAFMDMRTTENQAVPCIGASGTNLYYYVSGQNKILATNALPNINTWYHIALSKAGTNTRLFVNGTQVGQFVDTTEYINNNMNFGKLYNNTQYLNGYIDEIRVTKGISRYNENFTVATSAFANDPYTVLLIHADTIISDDTISTVNDVVARFNDNNIVGSITVSGTGITDVYNKVQIEFPHKDLNDRIDTITYEIPQEQWYDYEIPNTLNFQYDCINNPVQAEYLAALELKQSRVDKVINFRTDFSALGIKAGDLIEVTNSIYGYTNKVFRVLSVSEEDSDDNTILISITAFEYDSNVYDPSDLVRTERTVENEITASCANQSIADSEQDANEVSIMKLLVPLAASSALNGLWNMMFPKIPKDLAEALNSTKVTVNSSAQQICENNSVIFTVSACCSTCQDLSGIKVPYKITGVSASDIDVPLTGEIEVNSSGIGTLTVTAISDGAQEGSETLTFTAGSDSKTAGSTSVTIRDFRSWSATAANASIVEGGSTTVTFTTQGISGSIPYTITGTGLSQLSGTAANGNVIISGNTGTINITTKSISALQDTSLTIVLDPSGFYCSTAPATITITKTGTPPPVVPPDDNCVWVTVPTAWCGTFDPSTGALKTVFPVGTIQVLAAIPGQPSATVPLTASYSNGTITATSTVSIDTSSATGGIMAKVLTGFNAPISGVKRITGPTITVTGR